VEDALEEGVPRVLRAEQADGGDGYGFGGVDADLYIASVSNSLRVKVRYRQAYYLGLPLLRLRILGVYALVDLPLFLLDDLGV
jgi:hypothetical protein